LASALGAISARTQSSSGQPSLPLLPGRGGADTRAAASLNTNAITPPRPKGVEL